MYKLPKKEDCDSKDILELITEEQIFEHYLGVSVQYREPFRSPLRKDNNPTCKFFIGDSGKLLMKDFSGHFFGDCFAVVMYTYSCNYRDALLIVDQEFQLGLYSAPISGEKHTKPVAKKEVRERPDTAAKQIAIKQRKFSYRDELYWSQYGISFKLLNYYNVYAANAAFVGNSTIGWSTAMRYTSQSPLYAYHVGGKFKIYYPYASKHDIKWLSTTTTNEIQGFEQVPENVNADVGIITKSLKDVMVLNTLGYWSIAPGSENSNIDELKFSSFISKFKKVYILFDNDSPGIHAAEVLSEKTGLPSIMIPDTEYKDISDYRKDHTKEETLNLLQNLLK